MKRGEALVEQLAEVLHRIDEAAQDLARIDALLTSLINVPQQLFEGAGLFTASHDDLFVLTTSQGCAEGSIRAWKRWPLRRLFARMKPTRILLPGPSGALALAVPLQHGAKKSIVIAPIASRQRSSDSDAFFSALESITIPQTDAPPIDDDIPLTPLEPEILGFALCDGLRGRLAGILAHRGWAVTVCKKPSEFYEMLTLGHPDIVVVDTGELIDPVSTLRTMHRAASARLCVLAFEATPRLGLQKASLTDQVLPHDAGDNQIFATLKELVRGMPAARRAASARAETETHEELKRFIFAEQVAKFAALRAAEYMRGWAGVALISGSGGMYRAEYPRLGGRVLSKVPTVFLGDEPIFSVRVGESFLEEVFDDAEQRREFLALEPVSAVAVPIVAAHRRVGVLLAMSRTSSADSNQFEMLCDLAAAVGQRFHDVTSRRALIPEFRREGRWERWSDRALDIAVYRSSDCVIGWRYRAVTPTRGLLTIGAADEVAIDGHIVELPSVNHADLAAALAAGIGGPKRFAAVLDAGLESMTYAARDFPPPLLLHAPGPSGAIGGSRQVMTGVAALNPASEAVICDQRLWRWLGEHQGMLQRLPTVLEERTPPGFASVIRMGL